MAQSLTAVDIRSLTPRSPVGSTVDNSFTVEWQMTGDESQVAFYSVALQAVNPDQPNPFGTIYPMLPTAGPVSGSSPPCLAD